ncbi:MAG: IS5 family transposase [Parachlamydiaceae bacterium]
MPIENRTFEQKQGRFFEENFSIKLNPKNKLYKLRELIDWEFLESEALRDVEIKAVGRSRKEHRVMLALSMLQAMYNGSDAFTAEELQENMYWQYFCGFEYAQQDVDVSEATIRRFRSILGEAGYNVILKELVRIGIKVGGLKKKDLDSAIIDTTVQIKNIKHPHDVYLMEKAREEIVDLCKRLGIRVNDTYAKAFKYSMIKLWRYKQASKAKKRAKIMKSLKTRLGRLVRMAIRAIEQSKIELSGTDREVLLRSQDIHAQSFLNQKEKEIYKQSHKMIYSFHAPEVECIGKGKLNKPYEFGNKVSLAVSGRGNFVLAVKSFHKNPYDGHTLDQTISAVKESGVSPAKYFVDLGYRGHNHKAKGKIYLPNTKKQNLSKEDRLMQKRRSAIEPIIGHLKQYGRMGRNYLKGIFGDIINPLISAIGLNLRSIARMIAFT